jgi:hypothetical protein
MIEQTCIIEGCGDPGVGRMGWHLPATEDRAEVNGESWFCVEHQKIIMPGLVTSLSAEETPHP